MHHFHWEILPSVKAYAQEKNFLFNGTWVVLYERRRNFLQNRKCACSTKSNTENWTHTAVGMATTATMRRKNTHRHNSREHNVCSFDIGKKKERKNYQKLNWKALTFIIDRVTLHFCCWKNIDLGYFWIGMVCLLLIENHYFYQTRDDYIQLKYQKKKILTVLRRKSKWHNQNMRIRSRSSFLSYLFVQCGVVTNERDRIVDNLLSRSQWLEGHKMSFSLSTSLEHSALYVCWYWDDNSSFIHFSLSFSFSMRNDRNP